ncbi:MAG: DMT family transporter [Paraglaciecola sp.]|nr:DMT family transporter [Paraglaciecola sp.]NCT47814.1 DMT family transporter [Paraglaciecola sp.]
MNKSQLSVLTLVALFAFAANSIFCRLALNVEATSALAFSVYRLASAGLTLWLILCWKNQHRLLQIRQHANLQSAVYLLIYALGFSYAYIELGTANGALILFSAVQFTMLFIAYLNGKSWSKLEIAGIALSLCGLVFFVYPKLGQANLVNCLYMAAAGVAWGLYSVKGASSRSPMLNTASNFICLLPVALLGGALMVYVGELETSWRGILYSCMSGALASALGYSVWYYVLPALPKSFAAISQLSVPIWAALGGIVFVQEAVTMHFIVSALLVLGGIALVLLAAYPRSAKLQA